MLQEWFKRKNGDHKTYSFICLRWDNVHESSLSYLKESKLMELHYYTILTIIWTKSYIFLQNLNCYDIGEKIMVENSSDSFLH